MKKIRFFPKSHKYKYGMEELTPVTKFIGGFFEEFEPRIIARKLAKFKRNREEKKGVMYWLRQWKKDMNHGTRVHKGLEEAILSYEDYAKCIYSISKEDRDFLKMEQGYTWLSAYLNLLFGRSKKFKLLPEHLVYNVDFGIAGTIDLVIQQGKDVWLVDWKTNKAINTRGYDGKKCFPPIDYMDDCNFNKYALQLSMYSYLLEKKGFKVKEAILVHLKENSVVPKILNPRDYYEVIEKLIKMKIENDKKTENARRNDGKHR